MPLDPYEPCPCGSGKKVKFCCQAIVTEMEQVEKLQQSNQLQASMKKLDQLHAQYPDNLWVATSRASVLIGQNLPDQARQELRPLLKENPDHPLGLVLYASASFYTDGFQKSRSAIHRSFQKSARSLPAMVGFLAQSISTELEYLGRYMAARAHLTLAMKLVHDEIKREVFSRLHRFDSNQEIAYPLRSVHHLAEIELDGDDGAQADKAKRLADIGCWGPAAKLYAKLVEAHPEHADLEQNLGLCHAWDANLPDAAAALHTAARLEQDSAQAVECETLAQLLDREQSEDGVETDSLRLNLNSLSKALTILDSDTRFVQVQLEEHELEQQGNPSAYFQILDRSQEGIELTAESALDDVPRIVGQLIMRDGDPQHDVPSQAIVTGYDSPEYREALESIKTRLADQIESTEELDFHETVASEEFALFWRWHCPQKTPVVVRRGLERQQWEKMVHEVWPDTPLKGLHGKTPREAVSEGGYETELTAALYVLDSFCSRNRYLLDFESQCEFLKVPVPEAIPVDDNTPIVHFTALQLKRIDVKTLADDQLIYVSNRAMLLEHGHFLRIVLEEVLSRPKCESRIEVNEAYLALIDLAMLAFDRQAAFGWIEKAAQWAKSQENSFELILQWKMRELSLRVEDPTDPEIPKLYEEMWDNYGRKVPELREYLSVVALTYELPVNSSRIITPEDAQAGSDGVWTPGAEAGAESAAGGEEKKLWLPGQ